MLILKKKTNPKNPQNTEKLKQLSSATNVNTVLLTEFTSLDSNNSVFSYHVSFLSHIHFNVIYTMTNFYKKAIKKGRNNSKIPQGFITFC